MSTAVTSAGRYEAFFWVLLRVAVGWHFAYEGLVKILTPGWTSAGYLQSADWVAADVFRWMAAQPTVLNIVDKLNMWGLLLIGVALMAGLLTRLAALGGVVLLGLYYLAHPSLFGASPPNAEGSYLLVNKNVVELLALCVIAVRPGEGRLDQLFVAAYRWLQPRRRAAVGKGGPNEMMAPPFSRRQVLASLAGLPFMGGFVWAVLKKRGYDRREESQLAVRIDAISAPSMNVFSFATLDELKKKIPTAPLGKLELSRMMLGGNLMNGFAHARDLIYVSKLIKAYHQQNKVFETFKLAEACGINAIITNPILAPMITAYWDRGIGRIRFVAQCKGKDENELLDVIHYAIDQGACAAYIQGAAADDYVQKGKFDWIARALDVIRDEGLPAGIGGHHLQTIRGCVDQGLKPDFWMKTLHHHNYWSARVEDQHDNIWCEDPAETIAFMEQLPEPWIAFKVLAAGSIHPKDGFHYAFENGADFICVGMYDFQVVENVNLACKVLDDKLERRRSWCA